MTESVEKKPMTAVEHYQHLRERIKFVAKQVCDLSLELDQMESMYRAEIRRLAKKDNSNE